MMFLDETQTVIDRFQEKNSTSSTPKPAPSVPRLAVVLPVVSRNQMNLDWPFYRQLPCDFEAQAMGFYHHHFAIRAGLQAGPASARTLTPVLGPGALHHSMLALGYAGLSRCVASKGVQWRARTSAEKAYLDAVRAVKHAVILPEEAEIDHTLLAVHLMALYETTARSRSSGPKVMMSAWSNHVRGAAALLESMGLSQFETPESMRVFYQTVILACIDCIKQGSLLPGNIYEIYKLAKQQMPVRVTPHLRQTDLVVEFCHFYGRVRSQHIRDYRVILARAQALNDQAELVFEHADQATQYKTVPNQPDQRHRNPSKISFPACHDVYPSFHAAELWNGSRAIRLLLNQMVRSILLRGMSTRPPLFGDSTHTRLLQHSTDALRTLQDEVISSLPQYLGLEPWKVYRDESYESGGSQEEHASSFLWNSWSNTRESFEAMSPASSKTSSPGDSTETDDSTTAPLHAQRISSMAPPFFKPGGGSHLPWVLFILGATDIVTEQLKNWLSSWLRYIGETMNAGQALFLADRLDSGDLNEAWYRKPAEKGERLGVTAQQAGPK